MLNYIEILKSNPEYFKQFSCKDLLFLNYDCPVKLDRVAKWSEHNYFYYVLSGRKTIHTLNDSWELKAGSVVFVKRGACIIEQFFREPFCIMVFIMPDSFISRFINNNIDMIPKARPHTKTNDLVLPVRLSEVLRAFYDSVMPYFYSTEKPSEKLIELKFTELLLHIVNDPENTELISFMHEVASCKTATIEHVMEANFSYNLQLREYATLCNRSLSSFKRDFETIYKTTPGKWLLNRRLEMSYQLLTTTSKQLTDILLDSGFENAAHFSRAFKSKYGHSPLKYRKQLEHALV